MTISKEMMRALEADGAKLAAMTGEDHGPEFPTLEVCSGCGQEVDRDWCRCGDKVTEHNPYCCGHEPVPMGCCCGYEKRD